MREVAPDDDFRTDIDILPAERLVIVAVSGVMNLERLASLGPLVRKRQSMTPDWGVIYDFSNASAEQIYRSDLEALAAELSKPDPERMYRAAYVVPSNLSYGLARMYAVLADYASGDGPRARLVTRTRAEALDWIRSKRMD